MSDREILRHNQQVARSNTPPEPIPDPAGDIEGAITLYNAICLEQQERLGRIWSYMAEHKISGGYIAFGAGRRWTTNTWPAVGATDRPDLHLSAALSGLINPISEFDIGG